MPRAHEIDIPVPPALRLDAETAARLREFEAALDPANPLAGGGVHVAGYGEVSTALCLDTVPGRVCKRMLGFPGAAAATRYVDAVDAYLHELRAHGLAVADTHLTLFAGPGARIVVYLVQPRLAPEGLGANRLRSAPEDHVLNCVDAVLDAAGRLLRGNAERGDGRTVTVDAQLSNWWFAPGSTARPVLLDVGTPFMRRGGVDECGTEFFLAPVPALLRGYYRRVRAVERYIDDYFDARALALDLLGNFHKEGQPGRIAAALPRVNQWLLDPGAPWSASAITQQDVDAYYRKDAADLALYLRVRRMDRWAQRTLLRRRYPFILPGPIAR